MSGRPRVAVLDDYQGIAGSYAPWSRLADRVELTTFQDHLDDQRALAARLEPFEIVVAMRERSRFDRALLGGLPNLRLLVSIGGRNAAIDMDACAARNIVVCGTGGLVHGTAELTWALILAAARHLPTELDNVGGGAWMSTVGGDLRGRRLGIVGLGRLGAYVARIALAFGMDVVAWSENLTDERCQKVGVTRVAKDELLASSDYVTIHLVLSDRTRAVIGPRELGLMKPTAWLINTSRGPICDEVALVAACRDRQIAGACLDVFSEEPLPGQHPFRTLPNVLATPHVGYVTDQTYQVFFADVVEDIEHWLDDDPIRLVAND